MASLDANVVLRLLLQDQPQADAILSYIDAAKAGSIHVADAVLFECVWVLGGASYMQGRERIGELLLQLATIPQIYCNRRLLEKAVPRYVQNESISFIDACLVTYAELSGEVPLITYDKKLLGALPDLTTTL